MSGLQNLYRSPTDYDTEVCDGQNLVEILWQRFSQAQVISEISLVLPSNMAGSLIAESAKRLGLPIFLFDEKKVEEKPLALRQQRWNLEDDSGCEEWVGAALLEPITQFKWSEVILLPLENLLVEPESVRQSLQLFDQESFEVCFSADRQTGANWTIFSSEVLRAMMLNHEDLMWARGGLAWAVRKPLYPFKLGFFHCPRTRPTFSCDLRFNSLRNRSVFAQSDNKDFDKKSFNYADWLSGSGWEKYYTDFAPANVIIEPSAVCRAACSCCPHPGLQRRQGMMTSETFRLLLAGLEHREEFRFIFSGFGEPLLNPALPGMIELVADCSTMLITSLQQLPAADFPLSAVDQLRISVDALEETSFSQLRKGCNWKNVEKFIADIAAGKIEGKDILPEIGVTMLRSRHNEGLVFQFLQYWKKVARPVFNEWFFKWPFDRPDDKMQWYQILGENTFLGAVEKTTSIDYVPVKRRPCRHALLTATILWDGSVTLCPYDVEGKMVVGNVKTQSFIDIWRSERSQAFRAAHLNLDFAGASEFCGVCRDWYHNI